MSADEIDDVAARLCALFASDRGNTASTKLEPKSDDSSKMVFAGPFEDVQPTAAHWRQHIAGERVLGCYPRTKKGLCSWIALDVDDYTPSAPYETIKRIRAAELPVLPYLTKNGGARVVLFFSVPVEWERAERAARHVARLLGYPDPEPSGLVELSPNNLWMPAAGKVLPPEQWSELLKSAEERTLTPGDLDALVRRKKERTKDKAAYAEERLRRYCEEIAGLTDGRSTKLFEAFAQMFTMVNAGWIDRQRVVDDLTRAGLQSGKEHREIDEIRRSAEERWAPGKKPPDPRPRRRGQREEEEEEELVVVRFSDVEVEEQKWVWPNRFPIGALSLITGNPGLGKSQLAIDIAARITRGAPWPEDEGRAPEGNVVIMSVEDDIARTVKPRLLAAGGDPSRVYGLTMVRSESGKRRGVDVGRDAARLSALVREIGGAVAIIMDPATAYIAGKTNANETTQIRAQLMPVQDLATEVDAAIIGITHPPKHLQGGAMASFIGSHAWLAVARAGYIVLKEHPPKPGRDDEDEPPEEYDPGLRYLMPVKTNLSTDPDETPGLRYRIKVVHLEGDKNIVAVRVEWEGHEHRTANEIIMSDRGAERGGGKRETAAEWLRATLEPGPMKVEDIKSESETQKFSWRTVERAAEKIGVEKQQQPGMSHGPHWWWLRAYRGPLPWEVRLPLC